MQKKDELINKLNKDITRLERKLECENLYNIRNSIISSVLKDVQVVDLALPFIVSAVLIANVPNFKDNPPFYKDEITVDTDFETIDTSSGIHLKHNSSDSDDKTKRIKYSTGWKVGTDGYYERTETIYQLNDKLNLDNKEEILSMSKVKIEQLLKITDIKTIKKDVLTKDDSIYSKDALIIVNHSTTNEQMVRLENANENFQNSITYLFLVFVFGSGLWKIEDLFTEKYLKDFQVNHGAKKTIAAKKFVR